MKKCLLILSVVLLCGSGLRAMGGNYNNFKFDYIKTIDDLDRIPLKLLKEIALSYFGNLEEVDEEKKNNIKCFIKLLVSKVDKFIKYQPGFSNTKKFNFVEYRSLNYYFFELYQFFKEKHKIDLLVDYELKQKFINELLPDEYKDFVKLRKVANGYYVFQEEYINKCDSSLFDDRVKRSIIIYLLINFANDTARNEFVEACAETFRRIAQHSKNQVDKFNNELSSDTVLPCRDYDLLKEQKRFWENLYKEDIKIEKNFARSISENRELINQLINGCINMIINNHSETLGEYCKKYGSSKDGKFLLFFPVNGMCSIDMFLIEFFIDMHMEEPGSVSDIETRKMLLQSNHVNNSLLQFYRVSPYPSTSSGRAGILFLYI